MKPETTNEIVERIAREILELETLEVRNRDRLDFHELGVWEIRAALEAAYEAGRNRERRSIGVVQERRTR